MRPKFFVKKTKYQKKNRLIKRRPRSLFYAVLHIYTIGKAISSKKNKLFLNLKYFVYFYNKFYTIVLFKVLWFRVGNTWIHDLFKKAKILKTKKKIFKVFLCAFKCTKFVQFKFLHGAKVLSLATPVYIFSIFPHFFRFLYKSYKFRELSFVCQSFFTKLGLLGEAQSYDAPKDILSFSWDYPIMDFFYNFLKKKTRTQVYDLRVYIVSILERGTIKQQKRLVEGFLDLVSVAIGEFSFGSSNRRGKETFINFILFMRKKYLLAFKCFRNLTWLHFRAGLKLLSHEYVYADLACFKREAHAMQRVDISKDHKLTKDFKLYLAKLYYKGFQHRSCKVNQDIWFNELMALCGQFKSVPFTVNDTFDRYLSGFIYLIICFIAHNYSFLMLVFNTFKGVVDGAFSFSGLPTFSNIVVMVEKFAHKKHKVGVHGQWFRNTGASLKKKYKKFRVWRLWREYRNLIKFSKELSLKLFFKATNVLKSYYSMFLSLPKSQNYITPNIKISKFFNIIESRLDILLYRLGFIFTLFRLRALIGMGCFLVENYAVKFFSFSVSVSSLITTSLRVRTIIAVERANFYRENTRIEMYGRALFKTKGNYLGYLEVSYKKGAAILLRKPRFGEVTYMTSFYKFSKKRLPLFENIKAKNIVFSRLRYSKVLGAF